METVWSVVNLRTMSVRNFSDMKRAKRFMKSSAGPDMEVQVRGDRCLALSEPSQALNGWTDVMIANECKVE